MNVTIVNKIGEDMITKRKLPWIGTQDWSNILFLHWPVQYERLKKFVPTPFILDTYANTAWISMVIFQASTHPRFAPASLSFAPITQINVRTYVTYPGSREHGVYFLSLSVPQLLTVVGGRRFFYLPFHYAKTKQTTSGQLISVSGRRQMDGATFFTCYTPTTEKISDELAPFLTERYCIWTKKDTKIFKIPILHSKWEIYRAELNNVQQIGFLPVETNATPIAHYSSHKRTKLYPYETFP